MLAVRNRAMPVRILEIQGRILERAARNRAMLARRRNQAMLARN